MACCGALGRVSEGNKTCSEADVFDGLLKRFFTMIPEMNYAPDVNHPIHEMLIYQVKLENLLNHLRDELCKTPDFQIIPEMIFPLKLGN